MTEVNTGARVNARALAEAAKQYCPQGHPYAGDNLIIGRRGNGKTFRQCRTCRAANNRKNGPARYQRNLEKSRRQSRESEARRRARLKEASAITPLFDVASEPASLVCGRRGSTRRQQSCGRLLPADSFDRRIDGSRGPLCNTCRKLWESYRIGYDDWQRISASQGGVCAIDGCDTPVEFGGGVTGAHVDHDHACSHRRGQKADSTRYSCANCVRGLLCAPCNVAIGHVERNPQRVRGWIDYLAKWGNGCQEDSVSA